jgi:signal transduction histidine kinase
VSVFKALKFIVILIVVDSASNLGILIDYLKGFGFIVLEANSGEEALKVVGYLKPDVILLDVKLPGIDGFETCRQLKANQFIKNVPVIFMTTETSVVDKMHGFALGAVDYITKPIQTEELLARLRTHLTIQHLQSELETQNERLQQEIAEREKLIEELDAFAHTVAHDLKDPLGVTVNYAQFIKSYHSRMSLEDLEQYSDRIIKNGQKMGAIIDELLLLSSVRVERVTSEPIDMAPIVEEAQNRLAHMIEEAQAEVVAPDEWPLAWGYAPWIEEVWTNYISNAIKYGGTPPLIQLGATISTDNMVKFWVKDNGPGLTLEAQAQLFVPFSRPTQKAKVKGHGLGLSIVQRIVERLGGYVGVESNGQGGSVFSFSLPFYSDIQKQIDE